MRNIDLESIDEESAERVLDHFLEPYIEQGIGDHLQIDMDTSIENKASVAYYIINGDFSNTVENNVNYDIRTGSSPESHNFSSFREVLVYASELGDDIDYQKLPNNVLTDDMDFKPW